MEQSHFETDVWHIWKVDSRTIRWDCWSVSDQLGWFCMETFIFHWWWRSHQSRGREGLRTFRFCVIPLKGESEPNIKYCFVKTTWHGSNIHHNTELWTIDGEPMEFDWNIFPGFTTLQLVQEVQKFMNKMREPEQFQGRIIFMSMFNDIIWRSEDNERECSANATLVSIFAKRFSVGRWSFLGPGSEKKWCSTCNEKPQGEWDKIAEKMMLKFGESRHPVFRATSPLSRGTLKSKGGWKLSIHFCAGEGTIETFRTMISVNQLSIYGAVSDLCDEYSTCQKKYRETRIGRTIWLVVRAIKLIDNDT